VRHATSKLADAEDLLGVGTLGFRGEALASLATVAETQLRTRQRNAAAGTRVVAAFGARQTPQPIGRQPGTSVEVRDLFRRLPVRRAAAEPSAEAAAIRRLVGHLALSRPEIAFELRVDGRLALRCGGLGANLRDVFEATHGYAAAAQMLDFGPLHDELGRVSGLVSGPGAHRGRRDELVIIVNGRLCAALEIQAAIERAYAQTLPKRRYPLVVLRLDVPPGRVDANVHPPTERVALRDGALLAETLERELRALLGRTTYRVSERRRLAMQAADLPGLRAAEHAASYVGSESWRQREIAAGALPRLRVVGQIEDTLIVCESELGTLLVDQHRAHERVIYDRLISGESTPIDPPESVALETLELARLHDQLHELSAAGWRIDTRLAGVSVTAVPADLLPADLPAILARAQLEDAGTLLAEAACHAAIRKRRPLQPAAAVELLTALTNCANPVSCPHGQPIVVRLDRAFLERQFEWR
jgi:DNA mismatch repair protein MutL